MQLKKLKFKIYNLFLLLFFSGILFFITVSFKNDRLKFKLPQKFDFSGTNSLFIETKNGLKFNWITTNKTMGLYTLSDKNNNIISKGKTELSRVHSITLDQKLNSEMTFHFGGKNENIYNINLRPTPNKIESLYKNIDSIYVVGDVHGRYDELANLLIKSNIIDKDLNWIAGKSNLVFLGDLFDRGNDVTKVLWFIYELEQKAEKTGGKVHLVLGNHEIMIMTKDLRYLSPKEATIAGVYIIKYNQLFHPKNSLLGQWLLSKPSVLKINKIIFAHGGIVDLGTPSIDEFNQTVQNFMKDPIFLEIVEDEPDSLKYNIQKWKEMNYFFYNKNSPFWYRGYVLYDTLQPQLNKMLKKYDSKIHIVAHTPLKTITQKYKGKLITTDLNDAATQLLLLIRKKNKYSKYKIDSSGSISELN